MNLVVKKELFAFQKVNYKGFVKRKAVLHFLLSIRFLNFELTLTKQLIKEKIIDMRSIIFFLGMVLPLLMGAKTNAEPCEGMIWLDNVDMKELKEIVLSEGDYQVYKHEYVPHYKLGDFHLYIKGDTLILYNRHDNKRKEYTISNICDKEVNADYTLAIENKLTL